MRLNIGGASEADKVTWVLRYMQEESTEVWKDNIIKKLKQKIASLNIVNNLLWKQPDGVKIEKEKVQEVVDWPVLRSIKNIQKFLGLANYYRQFVKDFTRVEKLLHEMMRKDVEWNWGERQQKAFEELKERFTIELVLVTPDLDKEVRVEVDTSYFVTEGVLSMKCEDEKWRPVAYISKLLNEAKRNYEIHNK